MKRPSLLRAWWHRPRVRSVLLTGLTLLLVGGAWRLLQNVDLPPAGYALKVSKGSSWQSVARQLADADVIVTAWSLRLQVWLHPGEEILRPGVFNLRGPMRLSQLLQRLTEKPDGQMPLVLIEGENWRQLRAKLTGRDDLRLDVTGASDADVLSAIGAGERHLEGLFAPDTYQVEEGERDTDILRRLYLRQQRILAEEWAGRASGLPYNTAYEALIMASIIEKETGVAEERAQIAGVFVRRLQKGMRLQTDPTVIYGQGERFAGAITKAHLLDDNPYNTYRITGLPPTPIAMPSRAAIHAALNPAPGKALYFVAEGKTGRHVFSETLVAHNEAVKRFRRVE